MLHRITDDTDLVEALLSGTLHTTNPRLNAMLAYADLLTRAPASVRERHVDHLREVGLSDEEILSVALLTSLYNFWNRLAHGLGVPADDWIAPYLRDALGDRSH